MKYKHASRIAIAQIKENVLINEAKFTRTVMEEYRHLIPTPSSIIFSEEIGLNFNENDFNDTLQFLGSGFFADVYQVRNLQLGILMAFKVPRCTESMNRFMNEVQLLKCLKHANVLRFYGTCVVDGLFGCLTEFLDSGNLSSLIEHHGPSLDWSTGVRIAGDVSDGLSYLHSQLILHRDLSSENILLHKVNVKYTTNSQSYRAVIADFGLFLNLKNRRSDSLSTVGNPFYTAPENLRNKSPYNFASDVFSFGMILCEIITGLKNDPNNIPRTDNYGLNYKELKVKNDCPKWLQSLACDCCMMYVNNRPTMLRASEIIAENEKYIKLWHSAPVAEDGSSKLCNSKDGMKMRTMSMSIQGPLIRVRLKSAKAFNPAASTTGAFCLSNGSFTDRIPERPPICRSNSVDSFIDPRQLNLHKAHRDRDYVDIPLTTSLRQLDPRRNLSRRLSRWCSESDLSHCMAVAGRNATIAERDSELVDDKDWLGTVFDSGGLLPSPPAFVCT